MRSHLVVRDARSARQAFAAGHDVLTRSSKENAAVESSAKLREAVAINHRMPILTNVTHDNKCRKRYRRLHTLIDGLDDAKAQW